MSTQVKGDEKATLQRFYVNEGGKLPPQLNLDTTRLKRRRQRGRAIHFLALTLLVFYVIRKWSTSWTPSLELDTNRDGDGLDANSFNWSLVRLLIFTLRFLGRLL